MQVHPKERRRFNRIAFDAPTTISQAARECPAKLIDMSFKRSR